MYLDGVIKASKLSMHWFFLLALVFSGVHAAPDFSLEDYGVLPKFRNVTISPDGKHYAYISDDGKEETFYIANLVSSEVVTGARLGKIKARDIYFATNEHAIFFASDTVSPYGYRRSFEASAAYVVDLNNKRLRTLLNKSEGLYPAQGGLGKIVSVDGDAGVAYMPAYGTGSFPPKNNLYKVKLGNGKGIVYRRGNSHTRDWFVGSSGRVLARIDYHDDDQMLKVYSYLSGTPRLVHERKEPTRDTPIQAISLDETALLFIDGDDIRSLSLNDGVILKTGLVDANQLNSGNYLESIKTGLGRKIKSVVYSGLLPEEVLVNPNLESKFGNLQASMPLSHLQFMSATSNGEKIVARVSGGNTSGGYLLYEPAIASLKYLAREYPAIESEHIGEISTVAYKSKDGFRVPSVLTWPTASNKASRKKLPLIVFPHGGPASYDHIQFHWWAQYFARKGYLVLQPNFRGSRGFGSEHQSKGDKEWGKAMQDDVSNGVAALVSAGHADPKRVCIVGASYGGYSALAGGAFTPDLYRCVIAVAGVSDLPQMLSNVRFKNKHSNWVLRYWESVIGDRQEELDQLKEISPARYADAFKAPVLLIHGKDDTVVPLKQSKIMHKALRKADKEVELVTLKGEDHWLSKSQTRLAMLKAVDAFLDKHNPI